MKLLPPYPPQVAIEDALARHPDCAFADWDNGMTILPLRVTIVVRLWRNAECWAAGDPPRHVIGGYPSWEDWRAIWHLNR